LVVGFFGKLSFGYFINAPKVAKEIRRPPSIPGLLPVKTVKPLALPSKSIKSLPLFCSKLIFVFLPFPIEIFSIAFSPEWPNGGFPISCAKEAAATIENHSYGTHRLLLNEGIFLLFFTN
jgi:hypothetical protein